MKSRSVQKVSAALTLLLVLLWGLAMPPGVAADDITETGTLHVTHSVSGTGIPEGECFDFTFTFSGAGADGQYIYTTENVQDIVASGGTISLPVGETLTIAGMPAATGYEVAITPKADYTTLSVSVGGTITAGITSEAAFQSERAALPVKLYSITTSVTNGSITPSEVNIPSGETRTVSYSPNSGFHLLSVTIDGQDCTAVNPSNVTFTDLDADHTVAVAYEADAPVTPTPPEPPVTPDTPVASILEPTAQEPQITITTKSQNSPTPQPSANRDTQTERTEIVVSETVQPVDTPLPQLLWDYAYIPLFAASATAAALFWRLLVSDYNLLLWCGWKPRGGKEK